MIRRAKYLVDTVGLRGLTAAVRGKITQSPVLVEMRRPELRAPFFLRVPSSDVPAFEQIFVNQEYAFQVTRAPKTIIDAGGNIGLASVYFANKYPDAKIIALEPEKSNFELLKRNTAAYANVTPVFGALWNENTKINLVDPNLGKWGFMTEAKETAGHYGNTLHEVPGMTVDFIMKQHKLRHVDILKIDIEGAEREVFADTSAWLSKVDTLIVELHERMKSGCNRAFYAGSAGFEHEWMQGENVYLTRERGCLLRS
jgi:FkbM family methyltransferase